VDRVSDGIIWAGTAAVAFGVVVSSLLYGSEPPVLVVALVVLVGAAITMLRRRRRRAAWIRATMPAPTVERRPEQPAPRPSPGSGSGPLPSRQRVEPRTPPVTTTATGVPLGPEARRAGARGESLGDQAQPKPGSAD
jgi:hypothetical protein